MEDTKHVICPYCGQPNEIFIDYSAGEEQNYEEDCQVCCRPWQVQVHLSEEGEAIVHVITVDDQF